MKRFIDKSIKYKYNKSFYKKIDTIVKLTDMKILFVCQQYIHATQWINQLKDSRYDIYVFDCLDTFPFKNLQCHYQTGLTLKANCNQLYLLFTLENRVKTR